MPISAIGAIGGLFSNLFGSSQAQAQADKANKAEQANVEQWLALNVPDPKQLQAILTQYRVSGQLSPQLQQAYQQSQTSLKNMPVDATGRSAEVEALQQMQNLGKSGGMDAEALQQEQQAINQANANAAGQRGAIEQNFAARGVGGSGAQMAAELAASQQDADASNMAGTSAAAAAQQRALQAMQGAGAAGSSLNASDYGEAAAAAQAQDAINRFNTQNSQGVQGANVQSNNAAQAANLANAQSVSNANTGVANQQALQNAQATQQSYEDATQKATGLSGAYTNQAGQSNKNATNTANQWSNIGQAVSEGAGAIGDAFASKRNANGNAAGAQAANNNVDDMTSGLDSTASSFTKPKMGNTTQSDPSLGYAEGGEVKPSLFDELHAMAVRHNKYASGGDVLDANAREHIAPKNFALPGGRYPIEDEAHARNALSRVAQSGTPEEQAKVRAAVHRKYSGIGEKKAG